jgi:hypothetical protein
MWGPSANRGAYDFEAWSWTKPLCCGLRWGAVGRRAWRFIKDETKRRPEDVAPQVLYAMLNVASTDDVWDWWAHNGGRYDVTFMLDAAIRLGWTATGHVAGGRVVVLHLRAPNAKKVLRLFDSQAVVPSSLRAASEDFALASHKLFTEADYSIDVRKWPAERLEDGCRTDCELVLQLLERVESMLEEWGGGLRGTFSSSALSVVEARVEVPDMRPHRGYNEVARHAYCGGRVEVFHHLPDWKLCELDVCSSYPWSMSQPLPFIVRGAARTRREVLRVLEGKGLDGVVRARVTVPECHVPPLPWVLDGAMYFPTGTWEAWFQAAELRHAMRHGVTVEPFEAVAFEVEQPFAEYVAELYRLKSQAKGAVRTFAKLLLNGSYGKFAQKPERENLRVFASGADAEAFAFGLPPNRVRFLSLEDKRFVSEAVERWSRTTHYALAGAITAHSRILLHDALARAPGLAYCDTDSVHAAVDSMVVLRKLLGDKLGQLKVEQASMAATYYAPKVYELHPDGGEPHFASKGFPVNERDFRKMVRGEPVRVERMRLVKRQLRKGGAPARDVDVKRWSGRSMKRAPLADGSTRPWTVDELRTLVHEEAKSPARKGKLRK